MKRSLWKFPFLTPLIFRKKTRLRSHIQLNCRNLLISKGLLNKKIGIHNGHHWSTQNFTKVHLGHKLGEYVFTRPCDKEIHIKKIRKKGKGKKK
jgi:ribosomal protein S19